MRRKRFTAFTPTDSLVVMAYDAKGARSVALSALGTEPISVVLGDVRMKLNPKAGWSLNQAALDVAARHLHLSWPVVVVTNAREGDTSANYRLQRGSAAPRRFSHLWHTPLYHSIMLKSYLTPEEANESLWHELIHACQAEREGDFASWWAFNLKQRRGWNYSNRPMEVEAREGAKKFSHFRLTTPL